jgi:hypothetical protein
MNDRLKKFLCELDDADAKEIYEWLGDKSHPEDDMRNEIYDSHPDAFPEEPDEEDEEPDEPDHNDGVLCCPECERPNQFGELCYLCERDKQVQLEMDRYRE